MPHKSLHLWEKLAEARNAMLKAGLWELYDNYPFEKKRIEAFGSTYLIPKKVYHLGLGRESFPRLSTELPFYAMISKILIIEYIYSSSFPSISHVISDTPLTVN